MLQNVRTCRIKCENLKKKSELVFFEIFTCKKFSHACVLNLQLQKYE